MFFSGFAEWVSAFFLDLLLVLVHALSLFQRLIAGGSYLGGSRGTAVSEDAMYGLTV